ncbi:hypothetical protein IW262DRAFT_1302719 [Armillaria fumosa]|nr:hypothetical protein IW262DRAFT_1302719 [Armillaria fumosa]
MWYVVWDRSVLVLLTIFPFQAAKSRHWGHWFLMATRDIVNSSETHTCHLVVIGLSGRETISSTCCPSSELFIPSAQDGTVVDIVGTAYTDPTEFRTQIMQHLLAGLSGRGVIPIGITSDVLRLLGLHIDYSVCIIYHTWTSTFAFCNWNEATMNPVITFTRDVGNFLGERWKSEEDVQMQEIEQ